MPSGGGVSGLSGTPANLGKYTPKSSMLSDVRALILELADADPLGVDQNIDFTAVGGLDDCKLLPNEITNLKISTNSKRWLLCLYCTLKSSNASMLHLLAVFSSTAHPVQGKPLWLVLSLQVALQKVARYHSLCAKVPIAFRNG